MGRLRAVIQVIALVILLICGVSTAFAQVWVQWDGQPLVYLTLIANTPPGAGEASQIWYGEFNNLTLDYPGTLHAIGGGLGPFIDGSGNLINIWIRETVQNTGTEAWSDFHVNVSGDAIPYKKTEWPSTWNVSLTDTGWDYTADQGHNIEPGESFTDGIVFVIDPDLVGTASFEITKQASVPEPGLISVLAIGAVASGASVMRRIRRERE